MRDVPGRHPAVRVLEGSGRVSTSSRMSSSSASTLSTAFCLIEAV